MTKTSRYTIVVLVWAIALTALFGIGIFMVDRYVGDASMSKAVADVLRDEPTEDEAFIAALDDAGVPYTRDSAMTVGHVICKMVETDGMIAAAMVAKVRYDHLTDSQGQALMGASVNNYCPTAA